MTSQYQPRSIGAPVSLPTRVGSREQSLGGEERKGRGPLSSPKIGK